MVKYCEDKPRMIIFFLICREYLTKQTYFVNLIELVHYYSFTYITWLPSTKFYDLFKERGHQMGGLLRRHTQNETMPSISLCMCTCVLECIIYYMHLACVVLASTDRNVIIVSCCVTTHTCI